MSSLYNAPEECGEPIPRPVVRPTVVFGDAEMLGDFGISTAQPRRQCLRKLVGVGLLIALLAGVALLLVGVVSRRRGGGKKVEASSINVDKAGQNGLATDKTVVDKTGQTGLATDKTGQNGLATDKTGSDGQRQLRQNFRPAAPPIAYRTDWDCRGTKILAEPRVRRTKIPLMTMGE